MDIACPIASVKPDQANDPTSVISWSVDEEAWTQILKIIFQIMLTFSKILKEM